MKKLKYQDARIWPTRSMRIIWTSWVALVIFSLMGTQPAQASQVVGNNELAAYIGTGGLLLPNSFTGSSSVKTNVANCAGCTWAYTVFCMNDEELCLHSVATCPAGQIRYRVWFGKVAESATVVGSVCWGIGNPPTRRDVETRLDDLVISYVPKLNLQLAPPGGTLTSIPVIGWTDQPELFKPPSFTLAGKNVAITASAAWRWVWGDGIVEWKSVPGQIYPSTQISHQYRVPGTYVVTVTTAWQAQYSIEGIGTFNVLGDVLTQTDQQQITVNKAGSVLLKHTN